MLNLIGSAKMVELKVSFDLDGCSGNMCSKTVQINMDGRVFVYLDYEFL